MFSRIAFGNPAGTRRAAHPLRSEERGEVAADLETVHDIRRSRRVGSVHDKIPATEFRPRLITAVEREGSARPGVDPSREARR
jgi:hypothetical protein